MRWTVGLVTLWSLLKEGDSSIWSVWRRQTAELAGRQRAATCLQRFFSSSLCFGGRWAHCSPVEKSFFFRQAEFPRPNFSNKLIQRSHESRPPFAPVVTEYCFSLCDVTEGFDSSLKRVTHCKPVVSATLFAGCLFLVPCPRSWKVKQ